MAIKKILLTGDDGFNSIGTRILIHFLKDKYDLTVAGTKSQQSAVGGKISYKEGFKWEESEVDGVKAYVADGTPADSMELVVTLLHEKYDLILSGINFGANVGTLHSSGTLGAVFRGLGVALAPKGIALSWELHQSHWLSKHDGNENIDKFLEYPGIVAGKVVEMCIEKDLWGAQMLNINFPGKQSNKVKFVRNVSDMTKIYDYSSYLPDRSTGSFDYRGDRIEDKAMGNDFDGKALSEGYTTIMPLNPGLLDDEIYKKFKDLNFEV